MKWKPTFLPFCRLQCFQNSKPRYPFSRHPIHHTWSRINLSIPPPHCAHACPLPLEIFREEMPGQSARLASCGSKRALHEYAHILHQQDALGHFESDCGNSACEVEICSGICALHPRSNRPWGPGEKTTRKHIMLADPEGLKLNDQAQMLGNTLESSFPSDPHEVSIWQVHLSFLLDNTTVSFLVLLPSALCAEWVFELSVGSTSLENYFVLNIFAYIDSSKGKILLWTGSQS